MSAEERTSEASSVEQANKWAVWANEWMEDLMAHYSTRRFHSHFTECALGAEKGIKTSRSSPTEHLSRFSMRQLRLEWVAFQSELDNFLDGSVKRKEKRSHCRLHNVNVSSYITAQWVMLRHANISSYITKKCVRLRHTKVSLHSGSGCMILACQVISMHIGSGCNILICQVASLHSWSDWYGCDGFF